MVMAIRDAMAHASACVLTLVLVYVRVCMYRNRKHATRCRPLIELGDYGCDVVSFIRVHTKQCSSIFDLSPNSPNSSKLGLLNCNVIYRGRHCIERIGDIIRRLPACPFARVIRFISQADPLRRKIVFAGKHGGYEGFGSRPIVVIDGSFVAEPGSPPSVTSRRHY